MAKTKKPIKRYCQCGALLPADNPRVILCEACRKRKLEEKYAANKSPYVQDAARRAKPKPKSAPAMTIAEVVRAADAMGLSYGQFVARGLDKVWRG